MPEMGEFDSSRFYRKWMRHIPDAAADALRIQLSQLPAKLGASVWSLHLDMKMSMAM